MLRTYAVLVTITVLIFAFAERARSELILRHVRFERESMWLVEASNLIFRKVVERSRNEIENWCCFSRK